MPRDKDLETNYTYVKSLVKNGIAEPQKIWFFEIIDNFLERFTVDGVVLLLSVFYVLILLAVVASFILKVSRLKSAALLFLLAVLFALGAVSLRDRMSLLGSEAIVVQEKADARFEPIDKATVHFTLYEGAKVRILSVKDNWHKIRRVDGKAGWIMKSQLEQI